VNIPVHKFGMGSSLGLPIKIEPIEKDGGYNPLAPHRHNYFELFLFEHGGGIHMIDFEELDINTNEIHFLRPSQVHYVKRQPKCEGQVIKFTPDFLPSKSHSALTNFLDNGTSKKLQLSPNEYAKVLNLTNGLMAELSDKKSDYLHAAQNLLDLILIRCSRVAQKEITTEKPIETGVYQRFNTLLNAKYFVEHKVSYYAGQLGITEEQLNRQLKKQIGKSAHELLTERLNLEAKRLLLHTTSPIKQIALELGFYDNSYFNRWFNRLNDCTPSTFRKTLKEKYHGR
jgi:AraC-like DNA-binding protein